MVNSPSIATTHTPLVHRNRLQSIALWGVQVVLVGMFLLAGGSKLAGAATMVALFDAIGVGQWFRYLTGGIEVVSAVALLVPSLRLPSAPSRSWPRWSAQSRLISLSWADRRLCQLCCCSDRSSSPGHAVTSSTAALSKVL